MDGQGALLVWPLVASFVAFVGGVAVLWLCRLFLDD